MRSQPLILALASRCRSSSRVACRFVHHLTPSSLQQRPIEFTCSDDGDLSWAGQGMLRKQQSVNIVADVKKVRMHLQAVYATLRRLAQPVVRRGGPLRFPSPIVGSAECWGPVDKCG